MLKVKEGPVPVAMVVVAEMCGVIVVVIVAVVVVVAVVVEYYS